MTEQMIDNLDAQGHGGKSIVMGKDPVPKPGILRGVFSVGLAFVQKEHGDGTITFALSDSTNPISDAVVTYHRAPLTGAAASPEMVGVVIHPTTVVTWEWVAKA